MALKTFKITTLFHTTWQTLTPGQFVQIIQLQGILALAERSRSEKRAFVQTSMLYALCKNLKAFKKLTAAQIIDCFEALDFLKEPCLTFLVPGGPEDKLYNLTLEQVAEADAEFSKYMVTKEPQYMESFCRKLYGPCRDARPCVSADRSFTDIEQLTILHNYAACRQYFTDRCPNLFPKSGEETHGSASQPVYTGEMWRDLLYDLADTPAFEGLENAKNANFYEALDYLEKKAKEATEMRSKMKKPL